MYGGSGGRLWTFDLATGASSEVGPTDISSFPSLAFSPDGRLFGASNGTDQLYEIDPLTGAVTPGAELDINLATSGMDFASDGTLYLVEGGTDALYTVDLETGATEVVLEFDFNFSATDIAIVPDGTIFVSARVNSNVANAPDTLFSVDLETESVRRIGVMPGVTSAALGAHSFASTKIDIRPGLFPNTINLASAGTVEVALLSTDRLNAREVDPSSLRFGRTGE